jgi:hypothetical protein
MRIRWALFVAILAASQKTLLAQDTTAAPPADVASIEAAVTAIYDVISGPAGERDWGRFRSLFAEGARLIPTSPPADSVVAPRVLTVDQYVERVAAFFARSPFYERQIAVVTERYGHIAHVFSTYESLGGPDGPLLTRGINSIQLYWDGQRWWVLSILWDSERTGGPIPRRYGGGAEGA